MLKRLLHHEGITCNIQYDSHWCMYVELHFRGCSIKIGGDTYYGRPSPNNVSLDTYNRIIEYYK